MIQKTLWATVATATTTTTTITATTTTSSTTFIFFSKVDTNTINQSFGGYRGEYEGMTNTKWSKVAIVQVEVRTKNSVAGSFFCVQFGYKVTKAVQEKFGRIN